MFAPHLATAELVTYNMALAKIILSLSWFSTHGPAGSSPRSRALRSPKLRKKDKLVWDRALFLGAGRLRWAFLPICTVGLASPT